MPEDKTLSKLEQETFEIPDLPALPPPDVFAYNELRSCADLYRMQQSGVLNIQPHFQRDIVWGDAEQTRFIDSLIKQLPIPSMCFGLDYKTQQWQVIDGLQRMATIIRFLSDKTWVLSDLNDIDQSIAGQSVFKMKSKKSHLRKYYTRVENLTLPINIIRCDASKRDHEEYLFTIFHRLNAGGKKLNNQEIRNCIYSGAFNDLLRDLVRDKRWEGLVGVKQGVSDRFRRIEIALRLFAFHDRYKRYESSLARFLNSYMKEHRFEKSTLLSEKKALFNSTLNVVERIFEKIPRPTSVSILEGVLVGISLNLSDLERASPGHARNLYRQLASHREFSEESLSEGLSKKQRVIDRLSAAEEIFSK